MVSALSRGDSQYGEFYHWHDGSPEDPPNNCQSFFGGSTWSYDDRRGQWLHIFDENQPDLNWHNPMVRETIEMMVSWWLDREIDGFRLNAIIHFSKTEGYPDGDPTRSTTGAEHYTHGPNHRRYLRELYDGALSADDVVTVGEMGGTTAEEAVEYLGEDDGLEILFLIDLHVVDQGPNGGWDPDDWGEWSLPTFKSILTDRQEVLSDVGWDPVFLGNHDLPRAVSCFGDDSQYWAESATLLATFCMTIPGILFVYQGEEIGMTNARFETL